jgi:hypothetical protein
MPPTPPITTDAPGARVSHPTRVNPTRRDLARSRGAPVADKKMTPYVGLVYAEHPVPAPRNRPEIDAARVRVEVWSSVTWRLHGDIRQASPIGPSETRPDCH